MIGKASQNTTESAIDISHYKSVFQTTHDNLTKPNSFELFMSLNIIACEIMSVSDIVQRIIFLKSLSNY